MAVMPTQLDISVSAEKILQAVERIVEVADPLRVVAFGSRARGDFRPGSDVDLAVIVDHLPAGARPPVTRSTLDAIVMPIDLLVFDKQRHERMRHSPGSIHHEVDRHGLMLYNREDERRTDRRAIARLVGR